MMPLMTALQNSIFIGSRGEKRTPSAINIPAMMTP
jgi:hypothetical protein